MQGSNKRKIILFIILGLLPILPVTPFTRHVIFISLYFAYLGAAWDLLGGYTGQGSFVHAAFVGLGAYTTALMFKWYKITPYLGMFIGVIVAVLFALFVGYLCFRFGLKGHFFFLASLAFLVALRYTFTNLSVIGGATGIIIHTVKTNPFLYMQFSTKIPYCYLMLLFLIAELLIFEKILGSKLGYYFIAIREDEDAAESLGIDTLKYKLFSLVISAAFTSFAGSIYAFYVGYIAPDTVLADVLTVYIVVVAVIGGVGTLYGSIIGGFILEFLLEYTRIFLGGREGIDLIILGLLIMIIGVMYPYGLMNIFKRMMSKKG